MNQKKNLKELLPPFLIRTLRKTGLFNNIVWRGNYTNWDDALAQSTGYDSKEVLEKVKDALLKVKRGQAVHERDSVLFDEIEYAWPVLAGIMWIYAQEQRLSIVDFGGSLGSTYFQNRKFLGSLKMVKWNIIEQLRFVDIGIEHFQDNRLMFYYNIESCLKDTQPNCILLSCVLPYIRDPFCVLDELLKYNIKYLILDKMPFIEGDVDRLTVQHTPNSIYEASYPAWFFSEKKMKVRLSEKYRIIEEYQCRDEANIKSSYKGIILMLR